MRNWTVIPQRPIVAINPTPDQVKAARASTGLSQRAAATLVYRTARNWQQWEGGERKMCPALWELFGIKSARIARK
jgi:DNA-binding transcriptional regulator YiaG